MQFRVLGSLEVLTDAGDVVGPGGAAQRRLLAALLIDAGSVVFADRLSDLLGVTDGGLRTAVSRLRRAIGDAHVHTDPPGYRLSADDVDAARFEHLCRAARGVPPAVAAERLDAALALWRGDAYAEFAHEPWARPEAVRLEELRADAVEARADALLALGHFGEALASLERHTVEHPLRDRPVGLAIRALAAQGRQVEALRAYQDHYCYLASEVGTHPSTELTDLEHHIASGWHDGVPLQAGPGRGEGVPAEAPVAPSRRRAFTNLPILTTSFVGRSDDLAHLGGAIGQHGLVTLVGPGGIGKTRLAIHAAGMVADRFRDGVWLVELATQNEPAGVAQAVATTLSVVQQVERPLAVDIVGVLRSQQALLVLDNCEHVVDATSQLADAIVAGCLDVCILATAREGLAVPGEHLWPVSPLAVDREAVTLFTERATEVSPRFTLADHDEAVREICRRLDGVPLAIELAAARVQSLAPADIATLLDDRFRLLTSGRRATPAHHRTLRTTIEWSYNLLAPPEQLLFGRLGAFSGWFDLAAVRAVCGFDPLDDLGSVIALERLVQQSMVTVEDRASGRRYRLLETLRQFALEHLAREGTDEVARRHAHHAAAWIERVCGELEGPDEVRALADFTDGWDNVRTAMTWALAHEDTRVALRIGAALAWETSHRSIVDAAELAARAIDLPGAALDPLVLDAMVTASKRLYERRRLDDHAALIDRAFELCREHGWEPTAAMLGGRFAQAFAASDHAGMTAWSELAVAQARRAGDRLREARYLADQAGAYGMRDEGGLGFRLAEQAVALAHEVANPTIELYTETNLMLMLPDYREQLAPARQLLAQGAALGHALIGDVLAGFVAGLEARAGDPAQAAGEMRIVLRRLLDNDTLLQWDYLAPDLFFVLARVGLDEVAAVVHGHAPAYLAHNEARSHDDAVELARVTGRLGADEVARMGRVGQAMTPRDVAELAFAALDDLAN